MDFIFFFPALKFHTLSEEHQLPNQHFLVPFSSRTFWINEKLKNK